MNDKSIQDENIGNGVGGKRLIGIFFGFGPWRKFIRTWVSLNYVFRLNNVQSEFLLKLVVFPVLFLLRNMCTVYVWGYKYNPALKDFCRRHAIPFSHVEDGFVRSIALGATKSLPISVTIDGVAPYYDSTSATDLETLLNGFRRGDHVFEEGGDPEDLLRFFLTSRLSKYNLSSDIDVRKYYGEKTAKRILVIGQVESDASITFSQSAVRDGRALIQLARAENPDAQIIFKPHPETMRGIRSNREHFESFAEICRVLMDDIHLSSALETIDQVYTICSLGGFEALMRGIPVTTTGCAFYSGWGITDDRVVNPRRNNTLSVAEVFYVCYVLYPEYIDYRRREVIDFRSAIRILQKQREKYLENPTAKEG